MERTGQGAADGHGQQIACRSLVSVSYFPAGSELVLEPGHTYLRLLASGEGDTACAIMTPTKTDRIMPKLLTTMPQVLTRAPFAHEAGLSLGSFSSDAGLLDGISRAVAMNMGMYDAWMTMKIIMTTDDAQYSADNEVRVW